MRNFSRVVLKILSKTEDWSPSPIQKTEDWSPSPIQLWDSGLHDLRDRLVPQSYSTMRFWSHDLRDRLVTQSYSTMRFWFPLYQGQIGHPVLFNPRWDSGPHYIRDRLVTLSFSTLEGILVPSISGTNWPPNPMGFWSPLYQGQVGHPVLFNSRWDFGPLNHRDKLAAQSYSTLDGTLVPHYIRDRLATQSYSAMRFWSPSSHGQISHPVLFNYEIPVYPGTIIQTCMHSVYPGTIFTSAMHA